MKPISEQAVEVAIVADLTKARYAQRSPSAFDKSLCLDPRPVHRLHSLDPAGRVAEVRRSAPRVGPGPVSEAHRPGGRGGRHYGGAPAGCEGYGLQGPARVFKPEITLNPDTERLYQANQLTMMRQVGYSERNDHSPDLALFLNGLPLFTAELNNPLNGQDDTDAITQYRRVRELKDRGVGSGGGKPEEHLDPLPEILKLLNDRFGTNFAPADAEFLATLKQTLDADAGLATSFVVNTRENARLTFDHKVRDHVLDMIDTNFKFFKQINNKPQFAAFLNDLLFDRYSERKSSQPPTSE